MTVLCACMPLRAIMFGVIAAGRLVSNQSNSLCVYTAVQRSPVTALNTHLCCSLSPRLAPTFSRQGRTSSSQPWRTYPSSTTLWCSLQGKSRLVTDLAAPSTLVGQQGRGRLPGSSSGTSPMTSPVLFSNLGG